MDTQSGDLHARDALAKELKRFSLTYEQHQLLHGTGIGLVASQVAMNRKRFTFLLALLAAIFAMQAGRGLLSNGFYMFWAICSAGCAIWCWRRHANTRALRDALAAHVADGGDVQPAPGTLADELRLGFKLEYDEHEALHAGNAELAAVRIIDRCKTNTRTSVKGAIFISAFGLLWIVASAFSEASIYWGVSVWLLVTFVVTMCVIAIAISDKSTIARVEKLLHKHPSDTVVP